MQLRLDVLLQDSVFFAGVQHRKQQHWQDGDGVLCDGPHIYIVGSGFNLELDSANSFWQPKLRWLARRARSIPAHPVQNNHISATKRPAANPEGSRCLPIKNQKIGSPPRFRARSVSVNI